jgi:AcrR family transcriptional regulator
MSVQPDQIPTRPLPPPGTTSPRRTLTARQAARLERLVEAAVEELRAHGYEGLTVRAVASRCGVAAATAYTYFASKNHLVAEIFWRRLCALPEVPPQPDSPEDAVAAVMAATVAIVAEDPAVAAAYTVAVLAQEPEVSNLRDLIGAELARRIESALGDTATPEVVADLAIHWSGAFLMMGMGYAASEQTTEQLTRGAQALLRAAVNTR